MDMNETGTGMAAELHVVVGAGPIGRGVARDLASQGHRVRIITRSGSGLAASRPTSWPPTPATPMRSRG